MNDTTSYDQLISWFYRRIEHMSLEVEQFTVKIFGSMNRLGFKTNFMENHSSEAIWAVLVFLICSFRTRFIPLRWIPWLVTGHYYHRGKPCFEIKNHSNVNLFGPNITGLLAVLSRLQILYMAKKKVLSLMSFQLNLLTLSAELWRMKDRVTWHMHGGFQTSTRLTAAFIIFFPRTLAQYTLILNPLLTSNSVLTPTLLMLLNPLVWSKHNDNSQSCLSYLNLNPRKPSNCTNGQLTELII